MLFNSVHQAVELGASGVAIGRNIFQADDPGATTAALAAILHGGASVEEAMAVYKTVNTKRDH
jgi:DhnA family fructose-bisphosphate aldolase class Ia